MNGPSILDYNLQVIVKFYLFEDKRTLDRLLTLNNGQVHYISCIWDQDDDG
jgi:hypothetical protein